jgi:predicted deacylase
MGFDVPDMLAAGPRDVMVPLSGHAAAREVLLQAELVGDEIPGTPPAQVLKFMLVAIALVALIAVLLSALAG